MAETDDVAENMETTGEMEDEDEASVPVGDEHVVDEESGRRCLLLLTH